MTDPIAPGDIDFDSFRIIASEFGIEQHDDDAVDEFYSTGLSSYPDRVKRLVFRLLIEGGTLDELRAALALRIVR
jgi:hypothetical protein